MLTRHSTAGTKLRIEIPYIPKYLNPMQRDCVYFARALHDKLHDGENYQVCAHNVLHYKGVFIDAKGIHTGEELRRRYGCEPRPDRDGWNYIYDLELLKTYRKIMKKVVVEEE